MREQKTKVVTDGKFGFRQKDTSLNLFSFDCIVDLKKSQSH